MQESKKVILTIISFIAILIIAVTIYFKIVEENENEYVWVGDSYDKAVKVLNENFSTDIVLYGEELAFRENVVYRYINALNDELLSTDKEYELIIINDLNGTVNFTDNEIETLKKHVLKGKANLYYLGTEQYNKLKENGFTIFDRLPGDWSLTCEHQFGELVYGRGLWTSSDQRQSAEMADNNLCMILLIDFQQYLEEIN